MCEGSERCTGCHRCVCAEESSRSFYLLLSSSGGSIAERKLAVGVNVLHYIVAASMALFVCRRRSLFCLVRRLSHRKEFRRKKLLQFIYLARCKMNCSDLIDSYSHITKVKLRHFILN